MPRFAAFLRGVSPKNTKMPQLKKAFEAAGFTDVKTVLSSGNVVFSAASAPRAALQRKAQDEVSEQLGQDFLTIIRPVDSLRRMLASDPYEHFKLPPQCKRIVTFLDGKARLSMDLPIERDGARILRIDGSEVFSAYVPNPKGPVFMTLIEKTFGKQLTTRTWDTVAKVAR